MDDDLSHGVDAFIAASLIPLAEAQHETLAANARAKLPAIDVSPPQGKLLYLLARAIGAAHILEVGALGGYSTIWLARAARLRGGKVTSFEIDPRHAAVARDNLAREQVGDFVDLRVGPARAGLAALAAERPAPVDLAFIDADKPNNAAYFDAAVGLSRPGALVIVDNVVRAGAVLDAQTQEETARGARALFAAVAADPRVEATAIQTVGAKGWDGFLLALVK